MSGGGDRLPQWEGLNPPYATIVADPPWAYDDWPLGSWSPDPSARITHYSSMALSEIASLPVGDLAAADAHLYLWTTNRYLRAAYEVVEAWGFKFSQVLTWCKPPQGVGPGGAYASTTEFLLFGRRGSLAALERAESSWFLARRGGHSEKPDQLQDIVERVSPGPYVELFARAPRLGWDHWGYGYESERAS